MDSIIKLLIEFEGIIGAILGSVATLITTELLKSRGKIRLYLRDFIGVYQTYRDVGAGRSGKTDDMKPEELSETKDKMIFEDYISEIFLPWYKTQVKLRTYENRLPSVNKYFPYFYKMAVSDIEPIHVQNWQLKLSKNLKSSYVRAVQGLFSIAVDRAIVLGITTTNPSKIIGNVKKQKPKIEFWTKEEFEKIISLIYKKDYY